MLNKSPYTILCACLATAFAGASLAPADTLTLITNQSAQQATDSLNWASIGGDQLVVHAGGPVKTAKGVTETVTLANANSILSRACNASPCSWTGAGFPAGDILLWTSDSGNGGNGPVKIAFAAPIAGAGASLQADGPGAFIASIEAFDGSTSLGTFTVPSHNGSAVYIGVLDRSGPHITSVVFSLTAVSQGLTTDFALDTVQLTSALAEPGVSLSPSSLSFPAQLLKTKSAAKTITLRNSGTATLDIAGIAISGDFQQTGSCGKTLAINASCLIDVTFTPSAVGTRTGTLTITDNAPGSPHKVAFTGIGTEVSLSTTRLTFAETTVGKVSATQKVTLTNPSSATLGIASITLTEADPGDFKQTNTCGSEVAAGKTCTVTLVFQPKAKGVRTASLSITDREGPNPQPVQLTGTGQ